MKPCLLFALFIFSLSFFSCKKNSSIETNAPLNLGIHSKISVGQGGGGNPSGTPLLKGTDGNFRCSYGGLNLIFNGSMGQPTYVSAGDNGKAYGNVSDISDDANIITSYTVVNGSFAILTVNMSSHPNMHTSVTNYYKAFSDYVTGATDTNNQPKQTTLPNFSSYVSGGASSSAITGCVIYDSSSSSNLSVSPTVFKNNNPAD